MLFIVSDYRGSYHYVVDKLRQEAGAQLIELDPDRQLDRTISKLGILRQMVTPRLRLLRNRWNDTDTVLAIGWYVVSLLLLMRLRLLRRPRRLVSMGVFVHDQRLRRAVNLVLRALRSDELEFITFSDAERRNLVEVLGLPPARVHRVIYRGNPQETVVTPETDGGYVFTGGYSNRDYKTFFAAASGSRHRFVAVASALNNLGAPPPNVDLRIDEPWEQFERLIAGCALLVLPLREGGEACGQNVLFRGVLHHRPVVATRHDSLIDYLGDDYPGFVPPQDPDAMRTVIKRALDDERFRAALVERIAATSRWFREQQQAEGEILEIVNR